MMAAAEIHPLHLRQNIAELPLHRRQRAPQRRHILLAEIMKMQAADAIQRFRPQLAADHAQARAGRTRIINRHRPFGLLRIDAQAKMQRFACGGGERLRAEALPLIAGIENHMVGQRQHLVHIGGRVGGGKRMHLATEKLAAELRLMQAAGADAGQITRNQRGKMKHRKTLEREQHLGAALRLHMGKQLQIALQ